MNVPAKLAGFAAVLALVLGGSALAGSAFDVHPGKTKTEPGNEHGAMAAMSAVRGLAVSADGLTLQLARTTAPRGRQFELTFKILGREGHTVRDFDVEHTKRMHFIVVRRDLTGFQHLHPTERPDGTWTIPVTLPEAGTYRVFADFSVDETPHTLAADLTVDGTATATPLPKPINTSDVDGLKVSATEDLAFTVTRDGAKVPLRDYLGAKGHLVALREGDLAFLHVHPHEDRLQFEAEFPTPGRYRLFLQFQTTDGVVHTAAFTRVVTR